MNIMGGHLLDPFHQVDSVRVIELTEIIQFSHGLRQQLPTAGSTHSALY